MHYAIPGELRRDPEQSRAAPVLPPVEPDDDTRLGAVDEFTEWLADQCKFQVRFAVYVPGNLQDIAIRAEHMDVPNLVALALYPRPEAAGVAMRELSRRFLERRVR